MIKIQFFQLSMINIFRLLEYLFRLAIYFLINMFKKPVSFILVKLFNNKLLIMII